MKNSVLNPISTVFLSALAIAVFISTASAQLPPPPKGVKTAAPVPVTGANGQIANFFGIKSVTPQGLLVQLVAKGPLTGVTWDKLDLTALKKDNPHIYAAYQSAVDEGKTTELNLGSFDDLTVKKSKKVLDGFYENTVSGIKFAIQMPAGKPKGVLILLLDKRGRSTHKLPHGFDRASIYPELREKYKLALMAFDVPNVEKLSPTAVPPLVFAEKVSGQATLKAIEIFAKDSGNIDMTKAPILLYGVGKTGAAFVYNFTHWKPERVVAAAVSNGAFYSQAPTAASAKVPFLFLWGEYNDDPDRWAATNTRQEIFKTHAALVPNWISSMEFRGSDNSSFVHDYFAREFLKKMIALRKPTEIVKPKEEEKPKKEGEEEKPPPPPEPKEFQFSDISRAASFVGDLKTFNTSQIKDPEAPLGEDQTWLPDRDFAKMWKAFGLGKLDPPIPGAN